MPHYNLRLDNKGDWMTENSERVVLQVVNLPGEFPDFIEFDSEIEAIAYFKLTKAE